MDPGIDLATSLDAIQLAEKYPEVYAAVAIHPNDALTWTPSTLAQLEELANHPKVAAIGEIGLDLSIGIVRRWNTRKKSSIGRIIPCG